MNYDNALILSYDDGLEENVLGVLTIGFVVGAVSNGIWVDLINCFSC